MPYQTPLYCLDTFGPKAAERSFYIETLKAHLRNHPFVSAPHKHDFYLLLYITRGKGEHAIDFKKYPVSPGCFFLMSPGQVHSWKLAPTTDGTIIFFTQAFYRMSQQEKNLLDFPFFHSTQTNPLVRPRKDNAIDIIIEELHKEFKSKATTDLRMLRSYLDVLLFKLARSYPSNKKSGTELSTTHKLRTLEQLIEENYQIIKQPKAYGDMMNLSPAYLNTICKAALGKTLGDLITERVLLEARRLFAYSDMTVGQVSDKLNFSESSYFVRFFKKNSGQTPEQFKEGLKF